MRGGNKNSGRRSVISQRSDVGEIEKDLVLKRRTVVEIAKRCGISTTSVKRHRNKITEERRREIMAEARIGTVEGHTAVINEDRMDVSRTYDSLARRVEKLITKAEASDDDAFALAAMEGLRKVLRDIATMQGKLAQSLTVNISLSESKEWVTLRQILNEVIEEVPNAREPLLRKMRHHVLSVTKEDGGAL
jgi:AcrR family transcriptional regulator